MKAYFAKNEYGDYIIPPEEQRPIFLMGLPGIGKTAVMKQIAAELGVGLVSYSMTHHTRQSALGLPVITEKEYGGQVYSVTEYTMSEIIASVYDMMEETGCTEGILFLDEINCVSETLTPTMLQFLQYKQFGRHSVPGGWIVVTAGNPPEYNRSAREFDIVTWDRLKRIDIEPDYSAWREYALRRGVHASVLSYLDIKKENFYRVGQDSGEKRFVTARGWVDLSDMIKLCEPLGIRVDDMLIVQYLQDSDIAEDFAVYYDLFSKYRSDYRIESILSGSADSEIKRRAHDAPFDERLSLIGLLLDSCGRDMREVMETEDYLSELLPLLKEVRSGTDIALVLEAAKQRFKRDERRGTADAVSRARAGRITAFMEKHAESGSAFEKIKAEFDDSVAEMRASAAAAKEKLENMFAFAEKVWPDGQELLVIVTELTAGWYSARFIGRYGCDAYYRHNEELKFYERQTQIIKDLAAFKGEL